MLAGLLVSLPLSIVHMQEGITVAGYMTFCIAIVGVVNVICDWSAEIQ